MEENIPQNETDVPPSLPQELKPHVNQEIINPHSENQQIIEVSQNPEERKYKFAIYNDNHPENIRKALLKRGNFEEIPIPPNDDIEKILKDVNLIWRPYVYSKTMLTTIDTINSDRNYKNPLVFFKFILFKGF